MTSWSRCSAPNASAAMTWATDADTLTRAAIRAAWRLGGIIGGAVMAARARLDEGAATRPQSIVFSRCALARALRGAAPMVPVSRRGWAQLF